MNKPLKIALGVVVSVFCLWFAFRGFDFGLLKLGILNAEFVWFFPAALLVLFNMWLRSLRWKTLLSPLQNIPTEKVFSPLITGFFMNNILPARAGEIVRSVLLAKETGLPMSSVLGSVVIERITDLLGMALVVLCASRLLPWDKLPIGPLSITIAVGVFVIFILVILVRNFSNKLSQSPSILQKIFSLLTQLTAGFRALQSPGKIAAVLGLAIFIWMNEVFLVLLISKAMLFPLTFIEATGLLAGVSFGVMIPAAPGFIGTYEFFGKTALELLGKAPEPSLVFVITLHFFGLLMVAMIAGANWIMKGVPHDDV